jgi:lipopolysaccharide transport system ATP-binding protein
MATSIKVEDLSKIYRLGEIGTGTISRDLERFIKMKILKQEDPFLRIGEANDRAIKGASDIVYCLKDINFEINQGDAVGIIGRNGAGKSTLLKILSRVTSPTTGSIKIKGRVASLLEVGTGFHPELTGRENIYLNGAILGMRKKEIDRKFDEIVDFSGVERYIDTPVKRYSSGMYVRLAFAVAAHLESEILIVDEVLAVGDAEFQKKCLGKMGEVSKGEGRTILFVSHNMAAIRQLCGKGISLADGEIKFSGQIENILNFYLNSGEQEDILIFKNTKLLETDIVSANIIKNNFEQIYTEDSFKLKVKYQTSKNLTGSIINIIISNSEQNVLMSFDTDIQHDLLKFRQEGLFESIITIPEFTLKPGKYKISIGIGIASSEAICQHDGAILFEVFSKSQNYTFVSYREDRFGVVPKLLHWETKKIN